MPPPAANAPVPIITAPPTTATSQRPQGKRKPKRRQSVPTGPAPLLVNATEAAAIVGVNRVTWWGLDRSGRCPRPIILTRRPMWRADELRRWVDADCPSRAVWEARRGNRP